MNDWGRGYSKAEYGIDINSYEIYEMIEETKKRALEVSDVVTVIQSIIPSYNQNNPIYTDTTKQIIHNPSTYMDKTERRAHIEKFLKHRERVPPTENLQ
jgi:ubiquitin-protein ligase